MTYTGNGFTYNGQPMVPTGASRTLLIGRNTTGAVATQVQRSPLGAVTAAGIYSIVIGGPCR